LQEYPFCREIRSRHCGRLLFISHILALLIYGFIIFLTVSPHHYKTGSPAYLAHGVTLTLSVYIPLFMFIISTHLVINALRRRGISRVIYNSSIVTLVFMVVLIIGKLCDLFKILPFIHA
jgi:hypothetical protein